MGDRAGRGARRRAAVLMVVAASLAACGGSSSAATASTTTGRSTTGTAAWKAPATFSAPPDAGVIDQPISADPPDMAAHGYVEQEYFASGTAYELSATSTPSDGRWTFDVAHPARYRTRILVRRPTDPAMFDGNVVVEWMNVSAGESAPDWDYLNPALMDAGAAYVGVSAQALAVNGGKAILGSGPSPGLRGLEPARYGSLHHPGDRYSLDLFAQIGAALRTRAASVLGGLRPTHVLAVGESQSAFYLTTYADTIQAVDPVYQGIFIHSRGGGAAPIGGGTVTSAVSGHVRIRTDLHVPVFMFETQTDLVQLGYAAARQPDTADLRTWEVAGTSHADAFELGGAAGLIGCTVPVNDGPQHEVAQAAAVAFLRWVDHGTPPPAPAPFTLASTRPVRLALDAHGNVLGGVRTPAVDVPVSTLSGAPPAHSSELCGLFGSAQPFSPQTLTALYGSTAGYVAAYTADLDRAIAAGYLLPQERAALLAQAGQVSIPA